MGERSGGRKRWLYSVDRTAVLSLGLIAGFAIGLSFNEAGREQALGWFGLGSEEPSHSAPAAAPPQSPLGTSRPEMTQLLSPEVMGRVQATGTIHIGVFGDSYGDGYWSALYHQLPAKAGYEVLQFSKEATGFTRYRMLNLEERARRQVAKDPIDIAVISFGANDVQPIYEDGHLYGLLTPGWKEQVGGRISRFVAVARSTGAAVFWVGLPVMRKPTMDADIQAMNAFYAERMKSLGVPFIETRTASLDASGHYSQYLPDDRTGAPRLMRANDGIHMSMLGYQRLTAGLAERLRQDAAQMHGGSVTPGRPVAPASEKASAARVAIRPPAAATETKAASRSDKHSDAIAKAEPAENADHRSTERANEREVRREAKAARTTANSNFSMEEH